MLGSCLWETSTLPLTLPSHLSSFIEASCVRAEWLSHCSKTPPRFQSTHWVKHQTSIIHAPRDMDCLWFYNPSFYIHVPALRFPIVFSNTLKSSLIVLTPTSSRIIRAQCGPNLGWAVQRRTGAVPWEWLTVTRLLATGRAEDHKSDCPNPAPQSSLGLPIASTHAFSPLQMASIMFINILVFPDQTSLAHPYYASFPFLS